MHLVQLLFNRRLWNTKLHECEWRRHSIVFT